MVSAGSNVTICNGSSTTLNATGASTYVWTPASTLSCSTCVSPTSFTNYNYYIYRNRYRCQWLCEYIYCNSKCKLIAKCKRRQQCGNMCRCINYIRCKRCHILCMDTCKYIVVQHMCEPCSYTCSLLLHIHSNRYRCKWLF